VTNSNMAEVSDVWVSVECVDCAVCVDCVDSAVS
jgi:hypothetical protein